MSDCALTLGEAKFEFIMANFYEILPSDTTKDIIELNHSEVQRAYIQKVLR